ncbi:MAG: serine/threonine protein kinase [Lachnospiraceae bacterium]|nr:serine/threonine protein kinase [Lachnospiraceae bacterium]
MNIDERTKRQYARVFHDWRIEGGMIGRGSQGKTAVFKIVKENAGFTEYGALKIINIFEAYLSGNEDLTEEIDREILSVKKKAEQELAAMNRMKGHANIVTYHEFLFEEYGDAHVRGVDLLIRMDFLDNVGRRESEGKLFAEKDIIKMGCDLSRALSDCHRQGIIHRDIKPDNIFISNYGNYLLGDFGIAKYSEESGLMASTMAGSYPYAAPEQFGVIRSEERNGKYDERVDIYALGLSLYELANENKIPFALSTYKKREDIQRRLNGEALPSLSQVSSALEQVILKACAFRPEDRYTSAGALLRDFECLLSGKKPAALSDQDSDRQTVHSPEEDLDETLAAGYRPTEDIVRVGETVAVKRPASAEAAAGDVLQKKNGRAVPIIVSVLAVIGLVAAIVFLYPRLNTKIGQEEQPEVMSAETEAAEDEGLTTETAVPGLEELPAYEEGSQPVETMPASSVLPEEKETETDTAAAGEDAPAARILPDRRELEINDTYEQATELIPGAVIGCTLSSEMDVDCFKFSVKAPCTVLVEVYPFYQEDVAFLDASLIVHSWNGGEVETYALEDQYPDGNYDWKGKGLSGKRLAFKTTSSDDLSIRVRYVSDDSLFTSQLQYMLVATVLEEG